jgi:hypothetical protein
VRALTGNNPSLERDPDGYRRITETGRRFYEANRNLDDA